MKMRIHFKRRYILDGREEKSKEKKNLLTCSQKIRR
jgi:hypothetical protein